MRHLSSWYAKNIPGGFVVRDAERRPIAYVYGHDRPRQIEGVPSPLTIDEARKVALSIVELSEVLLGKDKASQDSDQRPSPPSAGKMGKRSRFDATPAPTVSAQPPHSALEWAARLAERSNSLTVVAGGAEAGDRGGVVCAWLVGLRADVKAPSV